MRNKKRSYVIILLISVMQINISYASLPDPPVTISPGTTSGPGPEISDLTPLFNWNAVSNADSYGLYISEYPYGEENLVFDSEVDYAPDIIGTIFILPESNEL